MTPGNDLGLLKQGLKTEIEQALAGECRQSVVLLLRDDRLPMAQITDGSGVVTNKVLSLVDLLSALDGSTTISQLAEEHTRRTDLPLLPQNTLLASVTERPEVRSLTVTGYIEPETYVFVLQQGGVTKTFDIPLPHIVYRAVYNEPRAAISSLSVALCPAPEPEVREGHEDSPGPAPGSTPGPGGAWRPGIHSPISRWPFSNVYGSFGGASEGVCWPGMSGLSMSLCAIPEEAVKRFVRTENNADLYGRGLSHNAPYEDYAEFLKAIEREGAVHEDYLIPTGKTVEELHYQRIN